MRYAVIDVFVDVETVTIHRKRYDNDRTGYLLDEACDLMTSITRKYPDTHYPYMICLEG